MKLSKSMIQVLICLAKGSENLSEVAKEIGLSINRCSELATELGKVGLVKRKRNRFGLRLKLANTSISENFRKMYLAKPYMKYEEFLHGTKLEILKLVVYEAKSVKIIAKITGIKERSIRDNLKISRNTALVWRKKGKYLFAKTGHPLIYNFLDSLRKFTFENKRILWKYNDEELFKTRDKKLVKGNLTGLNAYVGFGIEVRTIEYFCSVPEKKLTKKEIFVHSLLEIDKEPRLLGLAIAFYLKNNLEKTKLDFLISKYDLNEIFKEFIKTIDEFKNTKSIRISNSSIPSITRKEIQEILDLYGVKNV